MRPATIVDQAFCAHVGIEYYDFDAEEQERCVERLRAIMAENDRQHDEYLARERKESLGIARMLIGTIFCAACFWAGVGFFVYWLLHR